MERIVRYKFAGAGVELADDESFRSWFAFPVQVIDVLWANYGSRCYHRKHTELPGHFMWEDSFLRSPHCTSERGTACHFISAHCCT